MSVLVGADDILPRAIDAGKEHRASTV